MRDTGAWEMEITDYHHIFSTFSHFTLQFQFHLHVIVKYEFWISKNQLALCFHKLQMLNFVQ